ncbi:MAG TPA: hypothetical protein HA286_00555, partial [Candidatus Poseidoniaceae archaeon]
DDDGDDLFGDADDDGDDLFGDADDDDQSAAPEPEAETAPEVTPISFEEDESDDDVTDGVDELFG